MRSLQGWGLIHRWTSLICTAFLLLICVTGLPLIFADEIDGWLNPDPPPSVVSGAHPRLSLDALITVSRHRFPGQIITSVQIDDDAPVVLVAMAPSRAALARDPSPGHVVRLDARTGAILNPAVKPEADNDFVGLMLRLHTDLFTGLPGSLFMGAMALMFVAAIISGLVLYGPFTRKLAFGAIRKDRVARVRWIDLHNLLGVVTLAWASVVGVTGAMNELAEPLLSLWQRTDVDAAVAPLRPGTPPRQDELASAQKALETTQRAVPTMDVVSIIYPGGRFGSAHHYLIATHGKSPLTARLLTPVLIDARTGKLAAVVQMPWYIRTLEVSRPLHFGDYGGMPLKILWALLDLVTIVVLGSGLYLWIARPRRERAAATREALRGASSVMEPAE